ncbi:BREX-1 system adenine-specific DNA-methyltransferase PglX [Myroides marinus]|uniref:BREX-1 system adenine-specific DNA-methyltransferase PglX n=1 Tax=Myroides marinus TaxID=703342 RepID=UPI0025782CFA|nr:BREX-1 system adenine-specific DNA-methyltransferase PglX [Myroides marinus]MDM1369035.1 BREX-1 system adenine-specific DNA-methyltransferase PglX [Myroides marinus]MDM1372414.1 BREX-1 system adenine-specific DNA-methyltransferase PglX [Myroides marinus]MDM1390701.1 BREX-1 system adenine-specific DNA-methyltransferase PglX [Myroides marinus]
MNTNALKSFAKVARIQLVDAVGKQILYWGFSQKGEVENEPTATQGGYVHRGEVYNDATVLPKWQRLKEKITANKEAFKDVAEEAAYTWFNRLVAIKVLEENGFIDPFLQFADGTQTPIALQNAKAGNHTVTHPTLKANLQKALLDSDEEKAFAILLINYCNKHPMLNQVFGRVNDYTELLIPQNLLATNGVLYALNDTDQLPAADFKEVELIGWLYQFYISDKKDEVFKGFKAKKKARPEDIPAATQIFTPKWIVNYMVENTVGKIYLDFEEDSDLKDQMKYLVENETEGKGTLIDDIEQLTLIDPACGSGHILVTGFEWLYKMYREQGYTAKNAIESILKNNLFGLDIDDRAMQLARFAVLLKAAQQLQQVDASQAVVLMNNPLDVIPHIYAFPESTGFTSEEVALFTQNQQVQEVYKAFEALREGKNIGSALKISLSDAAREVLIAQYYAWSTKDKQGTLDIEEIGVWYKLKSYTEVALVLSKKYAAVVANPPYMGQKSMNAQLKDYVNAQYPMTKADLFAVFMEVCLALNRSNGLMGMINQHSWMFLSSFENYRTHLLLNQTIQSMLHLGPRTFEELSGEVVQSTAFVLENRTPKDAKGSYYRLVDYKSNNEKEEQFLEGTNFYPNIPQTNFDKIPGSPIAYWVSERVLNSFKDNLLVDFYSPNAGLQTGNNDVWLKKWYETNLRNTVLKNGNEFYKYNKAGEFRKWYGCQDTLIYYKNSGEDLRKSGKAVFRNYNEYFKQSLSWGLISSGSFGARFYPNGFIFDNGAPSISILENDKQYFLALLNSNVGYYFLKILNPTLNFQVGNISNIPVKKVESFNSVFVEQNISMSKKDWDSRETSWDFESNPLLGQQQNNLAAAYEAWVAEVSQDFFQLHANEEELNRIFIDIYGLQDELTPEVALKDITILQDELKADDLEALEPAFRAGETVALPIQANVVMQQFISYLVGALLGRYRLGQKGLHIAHPNPTDEELAPYPVDHVALPFQMEIDEDAIIPIMGSACAFPDDAVKRVDDIIHRIWGDASHTENLNFINQCLGMEYEKWMTEQFWAYHISGTMYKKKPIYWLFCSNPKSPQKSAFRVLVYMHRMDAYTVQKILRNYLHPHIEYVKGKYEEMHANEANLSRQELKVYENLAKQISELKEYEQKLKEVANLQITFDLDDGVAVNYAKFEGVVAVIK